MSVSSKYMLTDLYFKAHVDYKENNSYITRHLLFWSQVLLKSSSKPVSIKTKRSKNVTVRI